MITDLVLKFLCEECDRQKSGEMSVYRMAMAYDYACSHASVHGRVITVRLIRILGSLVDAQNKDFRNTPVVFANGSSGLDAQLIRDKIADLCKMQREMTPLEVYKEFESIHPFVDGNGRVGAIIYNMLLDEKMENPITPPDLFFS